MSVDQLGEPSGHGALKRYFSLRPVSIRDALNLYSCYIRVAGIVALKRRWERNVGRHLTRETWVRVAGLRLMARPHTEDLWYCSPWHKRSTSRWFRPEKDEIVIDAGAYIGTYSLLAGRAGARVIAIEPNPSAYESLVTNVRANHLTEAITALPLALGLVENRLVLASQEHSTGTASLIPAYGMTDDGGGWLSATVNVIPLDSITIVRALKRVDWLLVDVEGFEVDVLEGAQETLKRTRSVILEVTHGPNEQACASLLDRLGFQVKDRGSWSELNEYWFAENTHLSDGN